MKILNFLSRWFSRSSSYPVERCKAELWDPGRPLISVVVPCYNHGQYLGEAVDSVLDQTWQGLEVIVVDDGSDEEETKSILERFDKPKSRLVRHKANKGLPAARNTGIREAAGKYICCLDADDKLHPTYLEKALLVMESNAGIDFVWSWTQVFGDEDRVWYAPQFDPEELIYYNQLNPPAVFRRSTWEEVDGFREEMHDGFEDWEFWIRLTYQGFRGYRIPEKLIYVRRVGESFYHRALEIRQELFQKIKRLNQQVYKDQSWIEEVKAQYREVYIDRPFQNVKDEEKYRDLDQPFLWLLRNSRGNGVASFKGVIEAMDEYQGDAIFLSKRVISEDLADTLFQVTPYVYIIPHILPRHTWRRFWSDFFPAVKGIEHSQIELVK